MAQTERELVKAEPLKISTVKVRRLFLKVKMIPPDLSRHGPNHSSQGGLTVASIENHAPVTTLGVVIKVTLYYMDIGHGVHCKS